MSLRVVIVVTHLLGAGHLTRAAAIGRALVRAGHAVMLVTGGRPTPLVATDGLDVVQLPPVHTRVGEFRILRDDSGLAAGPDHLLQRRAMLLATLDAVSPDVLLTELFPFGRRSLAAEFVAALDWTRRQRRRPLVACSVRDILAAPSSDAKAAETHRLVASCYDLVLVHGDPAVIPLEASWPLDFPTASRLIYTGYVDTESGAPDIAAADVPGGVLVSGGSGPASLPLYRAALAAAQLAQDLSWRILVGRGVGAEDGREIAAAAGPNVTVEPARADFRTLLESAGVFVGQAGYNTVMDLFATGARAVLVPFERGGETEQRVRAEQLAKRGLATTLTEADLTAESLIAALRRTLASPPPGPAGISRDGAQRSAEIITERAASLGDSSAMFSSLAGPVRRPVASRDLAEVRS